MISHDSVPFPLTDLQKYLKLHGWKHVAHPNDRISLFISSGSEDESASLVLPASEEFSDYKLRLFAAIQILADHERQTLDATIRRIRAWDKDVFRARVFGRAENFYSLPLEVASAAIAGLKKLIGYAAYTETEPRPFFDKAGGVSRDFTNTCRFGHTFEGSFGFNIECPLSIQSTLPLEGVEQFVPFEREVMERIATGLSDLRTSIETDDIEPLVQNYHLGFSANMCRALEELYNSLDGRRVEYDFAWCPEVNTDAALEWRPFVFEGRAYEIVKEAARKLETVEPQLDSLVRGRVVQLKSEFPPGDDEQGEFEHIITMFWEREKGRPIKIRVPLTPAQYQDACDAHKEGRRIKINGIPVKRTKYWELTQPHDFTTL